MIIGIAGPARAGKDTIADYLLENLPDHVRASFADPMKAMVQTGLKLTDEQLYGDLKETIDPRYGVTPRFIMQSIGTDWGRRMINPDIWVYAMAETIIPYTVIPDTRFENEAKFIRENGYLIHVTSNRETIAESNHESEAGIMPRAGDFMVTNDQDLICLHVQVDSVLRQILEQER